MANSPFRQSCQTVIGGMQRAAWLIIAAALISAGLAVYYSATHLDFRTSRSDLVASDQKLIARSQKIDDAFGSRDGLMVVAENHSPAHSIAFAEALAVELRKYPQQFPELFYRLNPEKFKHWALLYLPTEDLTKLKANLVDNRRFLEGLAARPSLTRFFQLINEEITRSMIGHLFTDFLAEKNAEDKLPDLALLNATLRQLELQLAGEKSYFSPFNSLFPGDFSDLSQEGYLFTANDKYLLFLITPEPDGYATSARTLALLRQCVARVQTRFPQLQAGVTGPTALEADEMSGAMKDIALATWLSLVGQMLLLILFLRSLKRPLMECLTLVIGLCWAFGAATLTVGHLNLLSIIFAPLMLGLAIDFGIHWFCRLEEEQEDPKNCTTETLACALRRAAPGITYAAVASALCFFPLMFTGFKGLAELGGILSLGMLLMLVASLFVLPSLVKVADRCRPALVPHECGHPRPFLSLSWKRPGIIVLLGLGVIALGAFSLHFVAFDLNPLHLQNQDTESVVWEMKLLKDSRYSTTFGAMTADSLQELETKTQALKKLDVVSHVESALSFLPTDVKEKQSLLRGLEPIFAQIKFPAKLANTSSPQELAAVLSRIHFKLAQALENLEGKEGSTPAQIREADSLLNKIIHRLNPRQDPQAAVRLGAFEKSFFADLKDKWDMIPDNLHSNPPTIKDLPPQVKSRFISPQGEFLIRIFPSQDIWQQQPLQNFVKTLRTVDPQVVGDPVLLSHFNRAFRNACLWAAAAALAIITVLLLLLFRSVRLTLLALLPLFVGTGLTLIMMWVLGLAFNQANVLFLPLVLGEGIEFGIIILVRWRMEESARAITLPASTAKGVALAALTTTVGFGSLMISGHRGAFSLGLLATVGSISVLLASLSVLPAFLRLLDKRCKKTAPAFLQFQGMGRWLQHLLKWKGAP